MKKPQDLVDALSGEMAGYVLAAIYAAKENGVLTDETPLDGNSLGEIREQLFIIGREKRNMTKGDSDIPIGEAITLMERIAFHPDHGFWKDGPIKITYQLVVSGKGNDGKYVWLAQSPADVPYGEASSYYLAGQGGNFRMISKEEFKRACDEIEIHVIHERHPCASISEMVGWANESTPGGTH